MVFPMNVIIASAARTPVGRAGKGTLRHTRPDDLAALAMNEAVKRVKGLDPKDVEDVVLGCAMPEGEQGLSFAHRDQRTGQTDSNNESNEQRNAPRVIIRASP